MYAGCFYTEERRPERKADHSPNSSAETKNEQSDDSIPLFALMAWWIAGTASSFNHPKYKNIKCDAKVTWRWVF
jgi:hypothetical protein